MPWSTDESTRQLDDILAGGNDHGVDAIRETTPGGGRCDRPPVGILGMASCEISLSPFDGSTGRCKDGPETNDKKPGSVSLSVCSPHSHHNRLCLD